MDSSNQGNIDQLEKLQEKGLRLAEYQTSENKKEIPILKCEHGIESLKTRRKRSLLRLMYSHSHKVDNLAAVKNHMRLRSDKKVKLKFDFTRLTKVQRSPIY